MNYLFIRDAYDFLDALLFSDLPKPYYGFYLAIEAINIYFKDHKKIHFRETIEKLKKQIKY